jgi:hypothetical protein
LPPVGHVDLYSLEEPEKAGRGREYDTIFLDEAAFNKSALVTAFDTALRSTLLDRRGRAVAISTPNGNADDNFFFRVANVREQGWAFFTATTRDRPDPEVEEWVEAQRTLMPPLIFEQEINAALSI